MEHTFAEWLMFEAVRRNWSQADLARKSGLNRAVISKILSDKSDPSPESCKALAKALDTPIEEIYRAAGLLPPKSAKDDLVELITHLAIQLPTDEEKEDAAEYLRMRLRIVEERGKYITDESKRPKKTP
jgi:transcriptional regulator with XRE-family HTH domain